MLLCDGHQLKSYSLHILLGDPTIAGAAVLAFNSPVPWAQYMTVIKVLTHCLSKMFLLILFLSLPRLP